VDTKSARGKSVADHNFYVLNEKWRGQHKLIENAYNNRIFNSEKTAFVVVFSRNFGTALQEYRTKYCEC
jgi:hypothetical protein